MSKLPQLPFGHPDLPIRTSTHPCQWCGQRFSAHAYQWQLNQRRFCSKSCIAQKHEADREGAPRFCADCERTKIAADFSRFKGYSGHWSRRTYCKFCETTNKTHKYYNGDPKIAEQCCKVCGDIIVKRRRNSALRQFVTCSEKCAKKNRRRSHIECKLCQKMLPYEAFEMLKHRILRRICRKCYREDVTYERGFVGMRPTYHEILRGLRQHAKISKKPMDLNVREARRLWSSGCMLCGGKVGAFVHRTRGEKIDKTTIKPMCRPCAALDKAFPLGTQGLVEQACKIAGHQQPLSA